MADSVQIPQYISPATILNEGYSAGYNMREGQRKKALNNIFSESVDTSGGFDSQSFLAKAKEAGIGPEMIQTWLGQKTAKSDAAAKEATNATILETLGRKPDALRDWFEQEKQKATGGRVSEQGAGAPTGTTTIDADKLPNPDRERPQGKSSESGVMLSPVTPAAPTTAPSTVSGTSTTPSIPYPAGFHRAGTVSEQLESMIKPKAQEAEGQTIDLGQGTVTGRVQNQETFTTPDPGFYTEQAPGIVPQDKRYDVVEESLRKREGYSLANPMGISAPTGQATTDESIFSVPVKDDGTNEYRQYKTALDSKLQGMGMESPEKWLKAVHDYTLEQNTPVQPNPLAFTGKDGAKEFGEQMMKYAQGQIQAKGKAEEAVMKAKESLIEFAKAFGASTVDQRKLELPQGMILRDSSKRTEAAALITNRYNIGNAKTTLKEAGFDTTKLGMAAPQVIRAYATALNPGMQLSEGNLVEVSKALYPDMASKPEFLVKMATAMFRGLKGDWTGFQQLSDYADAGAPEKVAQRMKKIADEAASLNERNLANYVIKPVATKMEKETTDKTSTPSAKGFAGASPKANPAAHKKTSKTGKTDSKGRPAL